MAYEDCIEAITKAAGRELTTEELTDLIETLRRTKKRMLRENPSLSESDALLKAAQEQGDAKRVAAAIEKRNRAYAIMVNIRNLEYRKTNYPGDAAAAATALNVGRNDKVFGSGTSLDAKAHGNQSTFLGGMIAELKKERLDSLISQNAINRALQMLGMQKQKAAEFEAFDRDTSRELWRLTDDTQASTNNPVAAKTAVIIHKYQELMLQRLNQAGAFIRKMPGYIVRQTHDIAKVRGKGTYEDFKRWYDVIMPKLAERTFDGVKDRDAWMYEVWKAIASGVHDGTNADWMSGFKGSQNLAKKVSQERVLHFKDADSWFDYNTQYGTGTVMDSLITGFGHSARHLAALETWGPNPGAGFQHFIDEGVKEAVAAHNFDQVDRLLGKKAPWGDYLRRQFDAATGVANVPESPTLQRIASNSRKVVQMAKLGFVTISSLPDIGNAAKLLEHNGMNFGEAHSQMIFGGLLRGPLTGERRDAVDVTGVALNGMIGGIANRYMAEDSAFGTISKLNDAFFHANLQGWWLDRIKEGFSEGLGRALGIIAMKDWAALDPTLKITLERYSIDERTWNVIRKYTSPVEGKEFLLPDLPSRMSDADIQTVAGGAVSVEQGRWDLESKLRSYFADQTRIAVTEPGAREHAMLMLGSRPGSPLGELWRSIMLFKSFNATMLTRHIGREMWLSPNRSSAILNTASLIATTTLLGMMANAAKDALKGRTPRDWADKRTWVAGMLQGGGLGIYGDFLFGTSNRFGQSALDTAAGPILGEASSIFRIFDAARGKAFGDTQGDPAAMGVRFLINNLPFVNMFYLRTALDYFIIYRIQESLNPGFARRTEQRLKKDTGQTFFLRPTEAVR